MDKKAIAVAMAYTDSVGAGKASLVDGKVPLAQLPSFITAEVIEVNTFEDLPEQGEPNKIYVIKTGTKAGNSYRWVGRWVEIGDKNTYYSATPTGTTMGDLKDFIDDVNESGLHCFVDLHDFMTDAFVCAVHFHTVNAETRCEITDLVNMSIVKDSTFQNTDLIETFCANPIDISELVSRPLYPRG